MIPSASASVSLAGYKSWFVGLWMGRLSLTRFGKRLGYMYFVADPGDKIVRLFSLGAYNDTFYITHHVDRS